ncbi:hypothetical protein V496_06861 [Pseudogymnoascus sp. VKM F-4515 (FW-2607)]|nr:hypothetical protein V496_06861 [Pseudogymnoascus sp. VKM F-4515 (FW-2607)]
MADSLASSQHTPKNDFKHATSLLNILCVLSAGLGSFNYGYMNNVIAGSFGQVSFQTKFLSGDNATSITDAIVSGFFGFALIGAIVQAPISNKWGRKSVTFTAGVLLTISGALQAGSVNIAMFLVGRYIGGIGCGMLLSNTLVYMSEIALAHTRGLLVGLQGNCLVGAYVMSACAALGFHFVKHDYSWRLNFVVATGVALLLVLSLTVLPESPRWLVEKGRKDEAAKILNRLHRSAADPDGVFAHAELVQIAAQVEVERNLPTSYMHIIRTPSLRKRMFCTILVWTMGLSTGLTVLANLTPTLFGSLGYSPVLQLGLSVVWVVCLFIGCFVNIYLIDRIGRVKLLVAGGLISAALLAVQAALQSKYLDGSNPAGTKAAVAIYFLIAFFYTATIECTGAVYGCEIWPTYLRSQGATISYISFFITSIWSTAPAALAFSSIGWRYYMVFIAVTVPLAILCYFVLPETAGIPLEEIGRLFGDPVGMNFNTAMEDKDGGVIAQHVENEKEKVAQD